MNLEINNQTPNKNPIPVLMDTLEKWRDPFIEELHQVRARLLAKANGDMHQLIVNAHQTSVKHGFAAC